MYSAGAWGTVCANGRWHNNALNGQVSCQQLGYSNVSEMLSQSHTPSGSVPDIIGKVDCTGDERNLFECRHRYGPNSWCDNTNDAGVKCKTGS